MRYRSGRVCGKISKMDVDDKISEAERRFAEALAVQETEEPEEIAECECPQNSVVAESDATRTI